MNAKENEIPKAEEEVTNGVSWSISHYLMNFLDLYDLSFLQQCVSVVYALYLRLSLYNLVIYFLKYVPTCMYAYKFIKNIIVTSRERLKQKQMELEDIQLQIQIMNTKLCVCDAEFGERSELVLREASRLWRVRARVRDVITADDSLRRALDAASDCDAERDAHLHATPQEDNDFIMELLESLKGDHYASSERLLNLDKMDCGENAEGEDLVEQNSLYSSLSDMDMHQDCRVKIVKVTNVYKVAYLKHYIKHKRLRRANKRAALKKKMENIKKLLEDWQKTLSMVINSKLTILNIDTHPIDVASQEAMGDYSKPRDSSDSDISDLRNNDMFYDEYSISWAQYQYQSCQYSYEDNPETAVSREFYDSQDNGDTKYTRHMQCECIGRNSSKMSSIVEETGSQIAIEEEASDAGGDADDGISHDPLYSVLSL